MEINKEAKARFAIESYDAQSITIQSKKYIASTIVSSNGIVTDLAIHSIADLNINNIQSILSINPELVIIGHDDADKQIPIHVRALLTQQRIGMESMSVGAACRTFNILLSEQRNVVYLYIIS